MQQTETMGRLGIIFDCDGTLADSLDNALISFQYALAQIGERPRTQEEIYQHFGISADKLLIEICGNEARGLEAFVHFLDNQRVLAQSTCLHTGIQEMMQALEYLNIPLGLVTGRHASDLRILLEPHGLIPYFQIMVADNEVLKPKPDPEGILKAANFMGMSASRTIYIGDSPSDIQAAHAAGAGSVAVLWDAHADEQLLRAQQPHYVIHHPSELIGVFQDFQQKQNIPVTDV